MKIILAEGKIEYDYNRQCWIIDKIFIDTQDKLGSCKLTKQEGKQVTLILEVQ